MRLHVRRSMSVLQSHRPKHLLDEKTRQFEVNKIFAVIFFQQINAVRRVKLHLEALNEMSKANTVFQKGDMPGHGQTMVKIRISIGMRRLHVQHTQNLSRAGLEVSDPHPFGFPRRAEKRRCCAPPGFHVPHASSFRNFCKNFNPRSSKGQVTGLSRGLTSKRSHEVTNRRKNVGTLF